MDLEKKPNLAKAVIATMKAIKGVEKGMTVGTGNNSYQGVSDYEVKKTVGSAMEKNGLAILPISVDAKTSVDRWEENSNYGNKMKQSVFTEVVTKYLLIHESGESVELAGYGHGVDSQDKGAGKATTYALKYALLYAFLTPTGKIDDTDNDHSDDKPTKPIGKATTAKPAPTKQEQPKENSDISNRKETAIKAFNALKKEPEIIKHLIQVEKLTKYTSVADFVKGENIEKVLEVYNKVK